MTRRLICLALCVILTLCLSAYASPVNFLNAEEESPFVPGDKLLCIYFINTHGASDAILLVHGGKTMMIDCGDTGHGRLYVKPLLDRLGISHIDYAYNTHPHDDHINGFLTLFDEVSIGKFYTCFPLSYSDEQTAVMKSAMEHGIDIEFVDSGSDISFGGLQIWLYQDPKYVTAQPTRANSASMILHITYGESTLMITGDADKAVYSDLYRFKGDAIQSDIFKVPHHGYNRPSYDVFAAIGAQCAVITNNYSESIAETESFLFGFSCTSFYTGKGTVEAVTDGSLWTVRQLSEN